MYIFRCLRYFAPVFLLLLLGVDSPLNLRVRTGGLERLNAIEAFAPTWMLGEPVSFDCRQYFPSEMQKLELRSSLPRGLRFDNGIIRGTPTEFLDIEGGLLKIIGRHEEVFQELYMHIFVEPKLSSSLGSPRLQSDSNARLRSRPDGQLEISLPDGGDFELRYPLDTAVCGDCVVRYRVIHSATLEGDARLFIQSKINTAAAELPNTWLNDSTFNAGERAFSTPPGEERDVLLNGQNLPAGHRILVSFLQVYQPEKQQVSEKRVFSLIAPKGLESFFPLDDLFFGPAELSVTGTPDGMQLLRGGLFGVPSQAGLSQLVMQKGSARSRSLALEVREHQFVYPTPQDGPLPLYNRNNPEETHLDAVVTQIEENAWKVASKKGSRFGFMWRLSGLTRGGRYSLSLGLDRGTAKAPFTLKVMQATREDAEGVALVTSIGREGSFDFIAPDNRPWVVVSAEGTGVFLIKDLRVKALVGDEPSDEPRLDEVNGLQRIFNLQYPRKYRIGTESEEVTLTLDKDGEEAVDKVRNGDSIVAQSEILYVHGGRLSSVEKLENQEWPPPRVPVSESARYPFTEVYPPVPDDPDFVVDPERGAHGNARVFATVREALSAASGGETIVVEPGHYEEDGFEFRRTHFRERVELISREYLGAKFFRLEFNDVRNVHVRGFKFIGGGMIITNHARDITIAHNLFTKSAALRVRADGSHLDLMNNDFLGGPVGVEGQRYNPTIDQFMAHGSAWVRVVGNRTWFIGVDCVKSSDQYLLLERNLCGERYIVQGAHGDVAQPFSWSGPRLYSWVTIRDNVAIDDMKGTSGQPGGKMGLWGGEFSRWRN